MANQENNFTAIYNQTAMDTMETTHAMETTHFLDHKENKAFRRAIYDNIQIAVGVLVVSINVCLLALCLISRIKQTSLHRRMSFMMLVLVVFSLIHGIVFSVVYTLQRQNRYEMTEAACIVSTLTIEFCDLFVLVLLPGLALERMQQVIAPLMEARRRRIILSLTLVFLFIITVCAAWLPMIPELEVRQSTYTITHKEQKKYLSRFYKAQTCNQRLNRLNWMNSYIFLGTELACIALTLVFFLVAFVIFRSRTYSLRNLTEEAKLGMRKITCSIAIVCIAVVLTNLPYAVLEVTRRGCENIAPDGEKHSCVRWGIEFKFVLRLWFHFGNFLGPMVLIFSDINMRRSVAELLHFLLRRRDDTLLDYAHYTDHTVEINIAKPA